MRIENRKSISLNFIDRYFYDGVFTDIYVMPISTKQFIYEIKAPLMLRGDIFIHFFQVNSRTRQSELISSIQFHTCAIERNEIEFAKADVSFPLSGESFLFWCRIVKLYFFIADQKCE